jgi:hypothetical protein
VKTTVWSLMGWGTSGAPNAITVPLNAAVWCWEHNRLSISMEHDQGHDDNAGPSRLCST